MTPAMVFLCIMVVGGVVLELVFLNTPQHKTGGMFILMTIVALICFTVISYKVA